MEPNKQYVKRALIVGALLVAGSLGPIAYITKPRRQPLTPLPNSERLIDLETLSPLPGTIRTESPGGVVERPSINYTLDDIGKETPEEIPRGPSGINTILTGKWQKPSRSGSVPIIRN
jgi:hypothetical protein